MAKKVKISNVLIEVKNRKSRHLYHFLSVYEAGIVLTGTEIKSVRDGNANLNDAYCVFKDGELWVKSLYIGTYKFASDQNHETQTGSKAVA